MILYVLIPLIFNPVNSNKIAMPHQYYSAGLVKCVTSIITEYFAKQKVLTYVGSKQDDDEFLKVIHDTRAVSMISRRSFQKLAVLHEGYLISSRNTSIFFERFPLLAKEATWNPEARFLILVKGLRECQLKNIFNTLLKQRVFNVVVVNGSSDAHLYSYNPFDNYACGKRYDYITSHGKCSTAHAQDLYPNKFVTKLQNCTITAAIPIWPPYTVIPDNRTDTSLPLAYGVEPYLLRLLGKKEEFTLNITFENNNDTFSTVSENMEADGPLQRLQNNRADVVVGGLMLNPTRAVAFEYIYDFFPFTDKIAFIVRRASYVPSWKNVYLEFDATVWCLIVLSLLFTSVLMIILLRIKDKTHLVLQLVDNLVLHGSYSRSHKTVNGSVKCIFILWVWFAYFINTYYQSSMVSLTANPVKEHQITRESEIYKNNLKPCFNKMMQTFYVESMHLSNFTQDRDCLKNKTSFMRNVMFSKEKYYTMLPYTFYRYQIQDFFDNYGSGRLFVLRKPFIKIIPSMYFYKGFPLIHELRVTAQRLREMGLVDKALRDLNYLKRIRHRGQSNKKKNLFSIPWRMHLVGSTIAAITFTVEMLSRLNTYNVI